MLDTSRRKNLRTSIPTNAQLEKCKGLLITYLVRRASEIGRLTLRPYEARVYRLTR